MSSSLKPKTDLILILENIQKYLFILIPIFLITGPFLSDFAVSLIAIIQIYFLLKFKDFKIFNNFYVKFFIIFWIYILINSTLINYNLDSLRISFFYFRYLFFTIAIFNLLESNYKILFKLFYSILFCFLVLILDGFYQYFTGYNIIGLKLPLGPRASSFFGDELILGSYLSRLMPTFFGISLLLFHKKKKLYALGLVMVLVETLVFISGERTAFFYINLSAIFIILLIKDYKLYRTIILIFSALLILVILNINPQIKKRMIDTTLNQMGANTDQKYIFSMEHQDQYMTALKMFKHNKLFGVGIKQFSKNCNKSLYKSGRFGCTSHPHNIYLQFLSELGFIGIVFILYLLFLFIYKSINHLFLNLKKNKVLFSNLEICMLSSILITIWPLGPSGNFFNNWLSVIFYLPLPILLWSLKKNKKNLNKKVLTV